MDPFLSRLGIESVNSGAASNGWLDTSGPEVASINPTTGETIATIRTATHEDYETVVKNAQSAFSKWRMVPAPKRGEIIREVAVELRKHKDDLGRLITLEMGKVISEGLGEVQESIDMADFCVGLSRQLYGLSMHSERAAHRMYEQWHPLGLVGIITAFNFPNAVWAWNALVALIAGDTVIWKPSLKAPLTAIATHKLLHEVLERHGFGGAIGVQKENSQ